MLLSSHATIIYYLLWNLHSILNGRKIERSSTNDLRRALPFRLLKSTFSLSASMTFAVSPTGKRRLSTGGRRGMRP